MGDINKSVRRHKVVAIVFSCCLACGIPMAACGGAFEIIPLIAIGALCVVAGFYGTPFSWVAYANKKKTKRVVDAIVEENYRSVSRISGHLGMPQKEVVAHVLYAIKKRELHGFTIDDDRIVRVENLKEEDIEHSVECPYCGGISYTNDLQKATRCGYCGRVIEID